MSLNEQAMKLLLAEFGQQQFNNMCGITLDGVKLSEGVLRAVTTALIMAPEANDDHVDLLDQLSKRLPSELMDRVSAALAATGKQQVGEVQGAVSPEAVRQFVADRAPNDEHREDVLSGDYDHTAWFDHIRELMEALASRQPVGQEKLHGFLKNSTPLREAALRALGFIDRSDEHGRTAYDFLRRELHAECAAPPAQGIDMGKVRDDAICDGVISALTTLQFLGMGRGCSYHTEIVNSHGPERLTERALATDCAVAAGLIDGRDAGTGDGRG